MGARHEPAPVAQLAGLRIRAGVPQQLAQQGKRRVRLIQFQMQFRPPGQRPAAEGLGGGVGEVGQTLERALGVAGAREDVDARAFPLGPGRRQFGHRGLGAVHALEGETGRPGGRHIAHGTEALTGAISGRGPGCERQREPRRQQHGRRGGPREAPAARRCRARASVHSPGPDHRPQHPRAYFLVSFSLIRAFFPVSSRR